jgi:hypothetical protein
MKRKADRLLKQQHLHCSKSQHCILTYRSWLLCITQAARHEGQFWRAAETAASALLKTTALYPDYLMLAVVHDVHHVQAARHEGQVWRAAVRKQGKAGRQQAEAAAEQAAE